MKQGDILKQISDLTQTKFFPEPKEKTLKTCARLLEPILKTEFQAAELCQAVLTNYDDWPGFKTLVEIAKSIAKPTIDQQAKEYEEYLRGSCPTCGNSGHVLRGGVYERCGCYAGRQQPQVWIDELNFRARQGGVN